MWDVWGSEEEDHRVTNQLRLECKDKITKDHRKEGIKKDDTNFENIAGLFINSPRLFKSTPAHWNVPRVFLCHCKFVTLSL